MRKVVFRESQCGRLLMSYFINEQPVAAFSTTFGIANVRSGVEPGSETAWMMVSAGSTYTTSSVPIKPHLYKINQEFWNCMSSTTPKTQAGCSTGRKTIFTYTAYLGWVWDSAKTCSFLPMGRWTLSRNLPVLLRSVIYIRVPRRPHDQWELVQSPTSIITLPVGIRWLLRVLVLPKSYMQLVN